MKVHPCIRRSSQMAAFLEEALQRAKNRAKAAAAKVEDLTESHCKPYRNSNSVGMFAYYMKKCL
jgi:hypothetical protein